MMTFPRWFRRQPILMSETPGSPWGPGDDDGKSGPRNPWAVPPGGRKAASKPTALDEFLRRARGGGNGSGPQLPPGVNARNLWLIGTGLILALWVVFTSVHQIGPQQRGVVTYFGRYSGILEPGIRLTLPAPIVEVDKVDVEQVRNDDFPRDGGENVLTEDRNIIDLAYTVRWRVENPRDFVFEIKDPEETVRATAESAMRAVVATTKMTDAIGSGRTTIEARVARAMQQILDAYQAGVRVQGVSIKQASAPASLVDDFNAVTAAQQEAVANLNNARSYSQQVIAHAQGEAAQFDKVYEQYKLAPEVTRRRMYYETMEAVLGKTDKVIVETPGIAPWVPLDKLRKLPDNAPAQPAAQQGGQK
ncbi:protease modulator HflK [Sphingomonas sp. TX0543]|uniref:protease modulator HflK n=1 Tax=unclassified Sphingomonas TaxID=196159 RepID=UPI0010FA1C11|nr:protease modulator HflK [Sphingomonas sp. 3P27F8]